MLQPHHPCHELRHLLEAFGRLLQFAGLGAEFLTDILGVHLKIALSLPLLNKN